MFWTLLTSAALATQLVRPLELPELAARSSGAVLGTVVETEAVRRGTRIWTIAHVDAERGRDTEVWIPGGCLDDEDLCLTVLGAPRVARGDRVLVLLDGDEVTGLAQGLFHLRGDVAERDLSGLAFREEGQARSRLDLSLVLRAAEDLFEE